MKLFNRAEPVAVDPDCELHCLSKKDLDELVEKSGGEFKDLKSQYSDLKKMEDDVVHRAIFEAQKGSGLAGLTDVFSAGDIIGGTLGADPAFLARGIGQYFTKEVIQSLNDKNELIRQMFILGKNLPSDASPKLKSKPVVPKAEALPDNAKAVNGKSPAEAANDQKIRDTFGDELADKLQSDTKKAVTYKEELIYEDNFFHADNSLFEVFDYVSDQQQLLKILVMQQYML